MRTRNIAIVVVYSALVAASGAFLFGCDDSTTSSSNAPDAPVPGTLSSVATGAWKADKAVSVSINGLDAQPVVTVHDTIRADGSFTGTLTISDVAILEKTPIVGPLYVRSGSWSAPGDSILVLTPASCAQADTAATLYGTLPFSFPGMTANPLKSVPCGAPDTVRTRPLANGHWAVPMAVNLGGIASGTWVFDFVRLP